MMSVSISQRDVLILQLIGQRIEINAKQIAPPRLGRLRLARRAEVIAENPTYILHLRRLEPVHVIIEVAHAGDESFPSNLQTRQTPGDTAPFTAHKQRDDLLVFPRNRAHDWIRLTGE